MIEIVQQIIPQLTHFEKLEMLKALKAAIAEELAGYGPEGEPDACPRCGRTTFVRKGRSRKGEQRWLCLGCARTFSAKTGGLLALSKLDAKTWVEFASCEADALSLRVCAKRLGVSLPTAWFMRMRLCEVMRAHLSEFRPAGHVQVDSAYLSENLSGNRLESQAFLMPRRRHRNGSDVGTRGISNQKICVMTGINELGDCFLEVCCRGRESAKDAKLSFHGVLKASSSVISDRHRSYPKALAELGVAAHLTIDPKDKTLGDINMVNALHARLADFMRPFHGVATRRLQRYLDWFRYREQFKRSDIDTRKLLAEHAAKGRYKTTRRRLFKEPRLFMEYWKNQAA